MTRPRGLLVLAAALGASLCFPALASAQTKLVATVGTGDAFVITLTDGNGQRVTDLPAGDYEIEVNDRSAIHNFHLFGPGVDKATTEDFVGTVTWLVTLQDKQRYDFVCDPHASRMRGSFTTGGGAPAPPPPPPKPRPKTKTLTATVGPGATISLTLNGRRVSRLKAGRYHIVVRDRSAMHNFHLKGPGVNKKTAVGFKGTKMWMLTLRKGSYRFVCDPHAARMRGSFRVR